MDDLHPLERYRVRAGLSQVEAARQSGLNVKTLRNTEHGYTSLSLPNVAKLAKLYKVDPAQLLSEIRAAKTKAAA